MEGVGEGEPLQQSPLLPAGGEPASGVGTLDEPGAEVVFVPAGPEEVPHWACEALGARGGGPDACLGLPADFGRGRLQSLAEAPSLRGRDPGAAAGEGAGRLPESGLFGGESLRAPAAVAAPGDRSGGFGGCDRAVGGVAAAEEWAQAAYCPTGEVGVEAEGGTQRAVKPLLLGGPRGGRFAPGRE